jgi:hypothetical protein
MMNVLQQHIHAEAQRELLALTWAFLAPPPLVVGLGQRPEQPRTANAPIAEPLLLLPQAEISSWLLPFETAESLLF